MKRLEQAVKLTVDQIGVLYDHLEEGLKAVHLHATALNGSLLVTKDGDPSSAKWIHTDGSHNGVAPEDVHQLVHEPEDTEGGPKGPFDQEGDEQAKAEASGPQGTDAAESSPA